MPKQWRCAVVGVSVVGKIHVKVLDQLQNTTLAACCDLLPDRAQSILKEQGVSGVPVYKDLGEMLAKENLDVIHICTPSGLHMEPALLAMERGVSVIIEKPIEILLRQSPSHGHRTRSFRSTSARITDGSFCAWATASPLRS